jgi:MFS family permease
MQDRDDTPPRALSRVGRAAALSALMVTQTFGWGTSLALLGVLGQDIGADLGLSPGLVFSAAIVLYGCAALTAPRAGRMADAHGGARLLAPGALVGAASLALLATADGPVGYFLAWGLQGLAFHFMLLTACYTTITQVWGAKARRAIGMLTLATGLCATVIWPLTQALQGFLDWRAICLVYAAATLGLVVPVNLILARALRPHMRLSPAPAAATPAPAEADAGRDAPRPHAPPAGSFALLAALFALSAAIGNSVGVLMIDIFTSMGLDRSDAVHAASLIGVAFLVARGGEILFGEAIDPLRMSLFVFGALPLPFLVLLGWSGAGLAIPLWLAAGVALAYGAPQGLAALMRPALVQHIFGATAYGARLGRLSRVSDVASADTPAILAAVLAQSATAGLAVIAAMALACVALVVWLRRLPCPEHVTLKECPPCP